MSSPVYPIISIFSSSLRHFTITRPSRLAQCWRRSHDVSTSPWLPSLPPSIYDGIHSPQVDPLCTTCKAVPQLITIEIEWLRLRKLSLDDGCIVCHHLSRTLHLCAPIGLGLQPFGPLGGGLRARWTVFLTWLQLETPTWHVYKLTVRWSSSS